MSTMLRTENLTYSYPASEENEQPTLALDGVTLAIERGSFTVILGHNGSGKSTLAKTFNAVLLPSGGRVYVDGMDTTDEKLLLEIRRRVGMVFQNPDNQIVANVVEKDVANALSTGKLAGYGADVVSREPISVHNPLLKAPNCVLSGHCAWATREARQQILDVSAENLRRALAGQPQNCVN